MSLNSTFVTRETLKDLPKAVGVYLFHGKEREDAELSVLYVGKAKNLQSRVGSYFKGEGDGRPFVKFIQTKVEKIEFISVETEQDALLLENELIKKHWPAYNIHLKDDRRYLSLRLDLKHEWPKFEIVRKIKKDKAVYLGPFSSSARLRMTLDFMQKIFPLRTCNDHKLYNRSRPCLEYEIKRCVAPCVNYVTRDDYMKIVQSAVLFLKGQNEELLASLQAEMEKAASEERFEDAARARDKIDAIKVTTEAQGIIGQQQFQRGLDQDAVAFAQKDDFAVVVLLFVRSGVVLDKRTFEFKKVKLDSRSFLIEFLEKYYSSDVYIPHEVLVPFDLDGEAFEADIKCIVPRSEEKKNFLAVAEKNAAIHLETKIKKAESLKDAVVNLQKILHLSRLPVVMDCVDISHHQGAETVASVVRFREGAPDKNGYRKIKMKADQVDDFASMRDALGRRYHEAGDLPDLLIIDGGRGQLSAAIEVLKEKEWLEKTDLVALAKARDGEGLDPLNPQNKERVFKPHQKNPILLKQDSPEELLLRHIRDEAHRFAITYHRLRKEKALSASAIDDVPGMTELMKKKLLRRFGSVDAVFEADDLDLLQEIPENVLNSLREFIKKTT